MNSDSLRPGISTHTIRLVIGLIAITLPFITSLSAPEPLTSISASYCVEGTDWPRNIFVGFLVAISALFLAYNGTNKTEFYLSKLGAVATFLIANFPGCGPNESPVHGIASVIMFSVLTALCYQFNKSALAIYNSDPAKYPQAKTRSNIYKTCSIILILAILLVALNFPPIDRLVYYCETAGLLAFGIAWLVASKIIPVNALSNAEERVSYFTYCSESKH